MEKFSSMRPMITKGSPQLCKQECLPYRLQTIKVWKMMAMDYGHCESEGKMVEAQEEVHVESTSHQIEQEGIGYFMGHTEENSFHHKIEFTKKLASGNKWTCGRAIALLKSWLTAQENIVEEDLKKIWKGLFYCLSRAGKYSVQADLIENLVSLLDNLDSKLSQQYFKVFLLTLRQAWPGISDLQVGRFYVLLRQFLRHMFIVLNNSGWNYELTKGFMQHLTEQSFLPIEKCLAQAMNIYIADVYLSELQDFLPLKVETFVLLVEPFYAVLEKATHETLLRRIKYSVFDRLIKKGQKLVSLRQEGKCIDDNLHNLGNIVLTMGATSRLFKLATSSSTLQANRRVLCELHQEFSCLDRILIGSDISLHSPEANKPKHETNLCSDKSLKTSNFSSQGLQDPANDCQYLRLDITESKNKVEGRQNRVKKLGEKSKPRKAKKVLITQVKAEGGQSRVKKLGEKGKSKKAKKTSVTEKKLEGTQTRAKKLGEKGKPRKAKKVSNGVDVSSKETSRSKEGSELHKEQKCKEPKKIVEEAALNNTFFQETAKGGEVLIIGSHQNPVQLDKSVISNLVKQFDDVAKEFEDCSLRLPSLILSVSPLSGGSQKRKRVISALESITANPSTLDGKDNERSAASVLFESTPKNRVAGEKGAKRVTFALKNNLIWKPSTPLPPHSVRVPPSATPRGSALKKGVPPGPISIIKVSPSPKKIIPRKRCTVTRKSPRKLKVTSPRTLLSNLQEKK